jgi:BirA family biotin operon repressor/biotin-[acetyl-CoA-carboxylase] ligase
VWSDLDRPSLRETELRRLLGASRPWREVRVLPETGSTNEVCAVAGREGEPEGLVVVAESQTRGRGRLDRSWISPPRAGLTFSMLLRPAVPAARLPWLPLLVAVAAARETSRRCELDVRLKWPNDLLVGGQKVGGVLAEATGGAVVAGLGLNVSTRREELPYEGATSLAIETGGVVDRSPLLLALLRSIGPAYLDWVAAGGSSVAVRAAYLRLSDTIGRDVSVSLPGGEVVTGTASDVDEDGRLVVGGRAISAGDVTSVRGAP